jgi:SAM-dependent methyltransferase
LKLLSNKELEDTAVVANCRMNRERVLYGSNGYDHDLRFDPMDFLRNVIEEKGSAAWLDLCCGTGKALIESATLAETEALPLSIIGVDLVGMFDPFTHAHLQLVEASLSDWEPVRRFDLITCVHGLHYIGDKLDLIKRSMLWLEPKGRFAANIGQENLKLEGADGGEVISQLRKAGFEYCSGHKVLQSSSNPGFDLSYVYLGADQEAGSNYTGQPAVNSHYRSL